jgi:hypothetical protein
MISSSPSGDRDRITESHTRQTTPPQDDEPADYPGYPGAERFELMDEPATATMRQLAGKLKFVGYAQFLGGWIFAGLGLSVNLQGCASNQGGLFVGGFVFGLVGGFLFVWSIPTIRAANAFSLALEPSPRDGPGHLQDALANVSAYFTFVCTLILLAILVGMAYLTGFLP